MATGGVIHMIAATAPGAAFEGAQLALQLVHRGQFDLARIQPGQKFEVEAGAVQFAGLVDDRVLQEFIARPKPGVSVAADCANAAGLQCCGMFRRDLCR